VQSAVVDEEVVTVQRSPNPMPRPTVSLDQRGAARLTCPQCHTTKDVRLAPLRKGTEAFKVRCPCGAVFNVRLHEPLEGGAQAKQEPGREERPPSPPADTGASTRAKAFVQASLAMEQSLPPQASGAEAQHATPPRRSRRAQHRLTWLLLLALGLTGLAAVKRGAFVNHTAILPPLFQDPIQTPTTRPLFAFPYKGETYLVHPVAEYELWGLVVSHNNIHSPTDIYHDRSSVDTKDLCVIWGTNLTRDDFQQVAYWSEPWSCGFAVPAHLLFFPDHVSNNHLITAEQRLRDRIDAIRIGDQIHLKGLLVNYSARRTPHAWRQSSTTRHDRGNGACEVVFVEAIDILQHGTPGWSTTYTLGWWSILLMLVLKGGLLIGETLSVPTTAYHRRSRSM
jgi:hypothetical protein